MKTNEVSFYKTSKTSFAKTYLASFDKTNQKSRTVLRSLVLCAALAAAWPSMAQLMPDRTTDETTSHSAKPPKNGGQAAGYSHPANPSKNDEKAVGYVVDVYKSPECSCCKAWAEHLQKNGFAVILHDVNDVPAARKKLGMPNRYGSCHTAKVGQYLIEGHVPAADINQLLKEQPKAIGLAVPSMPPGSPGMEGERSIPYDTLLVTEDGNAKVFAHH